MTMKPLGAALALLLGLAGTAVTGTQSMADTESDPPIDVTIVAPLVVPAGTTGLIPSADLATYTGPIGVLTRELDAVIDRPVAIAIDPMIIASIRILGNAAPVSATDWLQRLASATNETFPLAYANSDLTLELEAGASSILQPLGFGFAIDPGAFQPEATPNPTESPTPTPTATPTADAGPPPFPTTESLLAWPYTEPTLAWPVEGTVANSSLAGLTAAGYETTIVSSGNVAADAPGGNAASNAGKHSVLISDDAVSALLREAATAPTVESWADAVSRLTAAVDGARAAANGGERSLVITLDRDVPRLGSRISETIDAITAMTTVTQAPLSTALGAARSTVTITDAGHAADQVTAITHVVQAEVGEAQFATVLDDPLALTAERRLHVLAMFAMDWQSNASGWQNAIDEFVAQSTALRTSVQVAESSTLNLYTNLKPIPINVNNTSSYPITVYITVRPRTGILKVEDDLVELTIAANSQGKGEIPVQAITNGTVVVDISLSSGTGVPIGHPTTVEINVQASWETPITIGLAALVVAFFAFGIVRTVLRRRKARRE
ncbi:MAG: DUF6049 family protein [Rhodoglobus sp.]